MSAPMFLLTDFGTADTYVGEMKAVIFAHSGARVADLTHGVRPGDVRHGAFLLRTVLGVLPEGSVTAAVVDPGVGSGRRILAAEWSARMFLAPDNGLLPLALEGKTGARYREVANAALMRDEVSRTFHGRDIFAKAAALLSEGFALDEAGPEAEPVRGLSPLSPRALDDGGFEAEVIHIDRFGNLVTVYDLREMPEPAKVALKGTEAPFYREGFYAKAGEGKALAYQGSHGYLDVAVNRGNAAERFGVSAGELVRVIPA